MTDADLRQYANQWIEARFVDGKTLVGRLVLDASGSPSGSDFQIQEPAANPDAEPPRTNVDPTLVASVRPIAAPPEALD